MTTFYMPKPITRKGRFPEFEPTVPNGKPLRGLVAKVEYTAVIVDLNDGTLTPRLAFVANPLDNLTVGIVMNAKVSFDTQGRMIDFDYSEASGPYVLANFA